MKQVQDTAPASPQRRAGHHSRPAALMLWLAFTPAVAQRPPAFLPDHGDVVLDTIPASYRALASAGPAATPTIDDVSRLIDAAQRSGDPRIAARAEAALAHWPGGDAPLEVTLARAWLAQHGHDFSKATALLDEAVGEHPRAVGARFMRAQVNLVQGRIAAARADCLAVALAGGNDEARLCAAAIATRLGRHEDAAQLLDRWQSERGDVEPALIRHGRLMRAEIAARAGEDAALRFQALLASDPDDAAVLAAYARHLRASGRPDAALQSLRAHRTHDRLLLESALAAHAAGDAEAATLARQIESRYAQAHQLELEPELRDEAEYWLLLGKDPARAYELAKRNATSQRDLEDVALLRAAGAASGVADPLAPLAQWASIEKVPLDLPAPWLEPR